MTSSRRAWVSLTLVVIWAVPSVELMTVIGPSEEILIPPEYGLVVRVKDVSGGNSTIDATIARLKGALGEELGWEPGRIHVKGINFAGSKIEFYFRNEAGDMVAADHFLSRDLVDRLQGHVPDLGLTQVSRDHQSTSLANRPVWTESYFPYAVAGGGVVMVMMSMSVIYMCFCWTHNKKLEDDDEEQGVGVPVTGQSIYHQTMKPELAEPRTVQPDSPHCAFTAPGPGTPVPAQPLMRIKSKGLLERRGSNASLKLDLNPMSDPSRWDGSPPKESTALEFLLSAGNRLSRRDLRNAARHPKKLYEEFWEIPMNHTEKVSVAGSGMKNRYKTIIPNEHSRVILPDIDNDPLNSYINANYIRGYEGEPAAYIATQGPMAHTVMDFWRLAWAQRCPIIVMITKLKEKSKPKCENYLPERWGIYGDVEVVIEQTVSKTGYILRYITLRCQGESHSLLHFWYTAWPDHRPPDSPHMLLGLIQEIERYSYAEGSRRGPVCVHCSAGIGRTGCFIAISIGIRQLREEQSVDVLGVVCTMRVDRGGMIQNHEQYDFVHQALAAYERELGGESCSASVATTPN